MIYIDLRADLNLEGDGWELSGGELSGGDGEMQEANVFSSRFASMPPAAPMATIWVRGARWPHSS